ncbi:carbohydrate kinase, FGGY [Vulcanisaeta moutnovskia 768-28]|uniref:Carbohydrate kinase, FGGY n=1 Tax=Vulcanisaeta moutnovskia (strain 768-28) TaxID=985053 RepID=F0QSP9_VULM7|nr:FGGY family carbohydrate kinase [Vulcanisaeta moutnovskia]ADY01566.1 carbohydrate kinase, FGGY [Vulcanisaeta moutnovskia 768-28]
MSLGVIDVGTTNIKLIIYDDELNQRYSETVNVPMLFPANYYVEQDANALRLAFNHLINTARDKGVKYIGISTYRASIIAWDKSGNPLINIITWLDRRGLEIVNKFPYSFMRHLPLMSSILIPTSPVTQVLWLLRNRQDLIERARKGEVFIGTLSSYLAYLVSNRYVNDAGNEALTGLWHPGNLSSIDLIYDLLKIPREVSPEVVDNVHEFGEANGMTVGVLIADQQAAMVGEGCLSVGCGKVTNGTGSFVDAVIDRFRLVGGGLLPLLILKYGGSVFYGVEGFLPATGSVIDWLVKLGLLSSPQELDGLTNVSTQDIVVIPALAGVNVPPRPCARGLIDGLTLNTTREAFVRAVVEGVVQLIGLIFDKIKNYSRVDVVRVDGGLSRSALFLRLLATALGTVVERQRDVEATARGVAALLKVFRGDWSLNDIIRGIHVNVELRIKPGEERLSLNRDVVKRIVEGMRCRA